MEAAASFQGELVIGGSFEQVDGRTVNAIARWNGQSWRALGSGMARPGSGGSVPGPNVATLAEHDGQLFVGGSFYEAGDKISRHVARWDGLGNNSSVSAEHVQPANSTVKSLVSARK